MRNYILQILGCIAVIGVGFGFFAGQAFALMPVEPGRYPDDTTSLLGQQQYYSVYFRGNGEAVVSFKSQVTNTSPSPLVILHYTLPSNIHLSELAAYQVVQKNYRPCLPYQKQLPLDAPVTLPQTDTGDASSGEAMAVYPCNFDQQNYYYPQFGNHYAKARTIVNGSKLTVILPAAIVENATGNILLSFRATGYATKDILGAYTFTFETLKTPQPVQALQVGVATEENYMLRDAKGSVNYQAAGTEVVASPPLARMSADGANQEIDTYYNTIGQGSVYKYTSNLAKNESYTVKGVYADSTWKLYDKEILIGLLMLEVLLIGAYLIIRRLKKTGKTIRVFSGQHPLSMVIGFSLVDAIIMSGYTYLLVFLGSIAGPQVFPYDTRGILFLFVTFISVAIYAFLLLIPSLIIGVKKGVWWGVITFAMVIGWMMVFGMLTFVVLLLFRPSQPDYPRPLPAVMMERGSVDSVPPEKAQ